MAGSVTVTGLDLTCAQGDRAFCDILRSFGADVNTNGSSVTASKRPLTAACVDVSQTPDLAPAVCVLACAATGTTIIRNANALKYKESDRLSSLYEAFTALGADIKQTPDELIINGTGVLRGGSVHPHGDHRVAMAAAVACAICTDAVTLYEPECVSKSYPGFFNDMKLLGLKEV